MDIGVAENAYDDTLEKAGHAEKEFHRIQLQWSCAAVTTHSLSLLFK